MGNFKNVDTEFVERTLGIISQYEGIIHNYKFEERYNHTLLINCLLGLIVFPKQNNISFLPKAHLNSDLKKKMGISESVINENITDLKDLVISLRNSIAHFDIVFQSNNEDFLIDEINFNDQMKGKGYVVAKFKPTELLNFIRYYGWWLIKNIEENQHKII